MELLVPQWLLCLTVLVQIVISTQLAHEHAEPLQVCNSSVVASLKRPLLDHAKLQWCESVLDMGPRGAKVVPGISWGRLSSTDDRRKFHQYGCSAVQRTNSNNNLKISCEDLQGDEFLKFWRSNTVSTGCNQGDRSTSSYNSQITCYETDSHSKACVLENAQLDFSRTEYIVREKNITRTFQKGFITVACGVDDVDTTYSKYIESSYQSLHTAKCNQTIFETVVVFSADLILNIAHTISDFMNLWATVWLLNQGESVEEKMSVLIIDSFSGGFYWQEQSPFYEFLEKSFLHVYSAKEFENKVICMKNKLVLPTLPTLPMMWHGRFFKLHCPTVGPGSLFQRYNLLMRKSFGLITVTDVGKMRNKLKQLVAVRSPLLSNQITYPYQTPKVNIIVTVRSGKFQVHMDSKRVMTAESLSRLLKKLKSLKRVNVQAIDLGSLSITEQMSLIANSSIVIGMHGASIAQALHMSIGTKLCCGVIEVFYSKDYHRSYRFYENSLRTMGISYQRIVADDGSEFGVDLPIVAIVRAVRNMIRKFRGRGAQAIDSTISISNNSANDESSVRQNEIQRIRLDFQRDDVSGSCVHPEALFQDYQRSRSRLYYSRYF